MKNYKRGAGKAKREINRDRGSEERICLPGNGGGSKMKYKVEALGR